MTGSTKMRIGRGWYVLLILAAFCAAPAAAMISPRAQGQAGMQATDNAAGLTYLEGLDALAAAQWPQATAAFSKSIELDGENSDYFTARGVSLALSGQLPRAIDDLKRAIRLNGNNWEARLWLGVACYMSGDAAAGSQYATYGPRGRQASRADTEYSTYVFSIGMGAWQCRQGGRAKIMEDGKSVELSAEELPARAYPRAAAMFVVRRKTTAGAGLAGALVQRTESLRTAGDPAAALKEVDQLLQASPQDQRLLALRASCLVEARDYWAAREEWTDILTADALAGRISSPAGYLPRARAAAALGDPRRARADLVVASRLGDAGVRAAGGEIDKALASIPSAEPQALLESLERAVRAGGVTETTVGQALAVIKGMNVRRLRCDEWYQSRVGELSEAAARRPKDPEAQMALAKFLWENRDAPTEQVEPRPVPIPYRRQRFNAREVEISRAMEMAEATLKLQPDHVMAMATKASILLYYSQFDEAQPLLKKALALRPQDPELLQLMAESLVQEARDKRAQASATRAAAETRTESYGPTGSDGYRTVTVTKTYDQAGIARAVKLDDEAQELMDMASETMGRALKLSAGTARGFYNQGWLDWRNRRIKEAKADFEKAVRMQNDYTLAWRWLAIICKELDLTEEAAAASSRADNMFETTAAPWLVAAWQRILQTRWKTAREDLALARGIDPADPRVEALLALVDLGDGKADEAAVEFRTVLAMEEARARLRGRTLGPKSALTLGPEDVGLTLAAQIRLGAILLRQGRADEAAAQFQAGLSLLAAMPAAGAKAAGVPRSFLPNGAWENEVPVPPDTCERLAIRCREGLEYAAFAKLYPAAADDAGQAFARWVLDLPADHPDPDGFVRTMASLGLAEMYLQKNNLAQAARIYKREVTGVRQDLWMRMLAVESQIAGQTQALQEQQGQDPETQEFRRRMQAIPAAQRRAMLTSEKRRCEGTKRILQDTLARSTQAGDKQSLTADIDKMDRRIALCDELLREIRN